MSHRMSKPPEGIGVLVSGFRLFGSQDSEESDVVCPDQLRLSLGFRVRE